MKEQETGPVSDSSLLHWYGAWLLWKRYPTGMCDSMNLSASLIVADRLDLSKSTSYILSGGKILWIEIVLYLLLKCMARNKLCSLREAQADYRDKHRGLRCPPSNCCLWGGLLEAWVLGGGIFWRLPLHMTLNSFRYTNRIQWQMVPFCASLRVWVNSTMFPESWPMKCPAIFGWTFDRFAEKPVGCSSSLCGVIPTHRGQGQKEIFFILYLEPLDTPRWLWLGVENDDLEPFECLPRATFWKGRLRPHHLHHYTCTPTS